MKKRISSKKKKKFKDYFFPVEKRWDFLFVFMFLLGRLFLNIEGDSLSIFFAASYIILILMMFTHKKIFFVGTIMFLFADSLIGTILFTLRNDLNFAYFWTMFFNLFIIFLIVFDMKGNFRKN